MDGQTDGREVEIWMDGRIDGQTDRPIGLTAAEAK